MARHHRRVRRPGDFLWRRGFALAELIVALLLFAIGGVALAGTSAVIGRALNVDATRERAARVASRQIEILAASCRVAASGRESSPAIDSQWSVSRPDANHVDINESVSYLTARGRRTDSYRAVLPCP